MNHPQQLNNKILLELYNNIIKFLEIYYNKIEIPQSLYHSSTRLLIDNIIEAKQILNKLKIRMKDIKKEKIKAIVVGNNNNYSDKLLFINAPIDVNFINFNDVCNDENNIDTLLKNHSDVNLVIYLLKFGEKISIYGEDLINEIHKHNDNIPFLFVVNTFNAIEEKEEYKKELLEQISELLSINNYNNNFIHFLNLEKEEVDRDMKSENFNYLIQCLKNTIIRNYLYKHVLFLKNKIHQLILLKTNNETIKKEHEEILSNNEIDLLLINEQLEEYDIYKEQYEDHKNTITFDNQIDIAKINSKIDNENSIYNTEMAEIKHTIEEHTNKKNNLDKKIDCYQKLNKTVEELCETIDNNENPKSIIDDNQKDSNTIQDIFNTLQSQYDNKKHELINERDSMEKKYRSMNNEEQLKKLSEEHERKLKDFEEEKRVTQCRYTEEMNQFLSNDIFKEYDALLKRFDELSLERDIIEQDYHKIKIFIESENYINKTLNTYYEIIEKYMSQFNRNQNGAFSYFNNDVNIKESSKTTVILDEDDSLFLDSNSDYESEDDFYEDDRKSQYLKYIEENI